MGRADELTFDGGESRGVVIIECARCSLILVMRGPERSHITGLQRPGVQFELLLAVHHHRVVDVRDQGSASTWALFGHADHDRERRRRDDVGKARRLGGGAIAMGVRVADRIGELPQLLPAYFVRLSQAETSAEEVGG